MTTLSRSANKPADPVSLAARIAAKLPRATDFVETLCMLAVAATMTGILNLML